MNMMDVACDLPVGTRGIGRFWSGKSKVLMELKAMFID